MNEGLKILRYFVGPYKKRFFLLIALSLATVGSEYFALAMIFNFINSMLGNNPTLSKMHSLFVFLQKLINLLPVKDLFIASCIAVSAAAVINYIISSLYKYQMEYFTQLIRIDLQRKVSVRYLDAEYRFFLERNQGNLLFNILQAPQYVSMVISLLIKTSVSVLMLVFLQWLLFMVSFKITVVVILVCVIIGYFVMVTSNRVGYREGKKANMALSALNVVLNEFITGIKEVKVNLLKSDVKNRVDCDNMSFLKAKMKVALYRITLNNIFSVLSIIIICSIFAVSKQHSSGDFNYLIPGLILYVATVMRAMPIVKEIGEDAINVSHYAPNLKLLHEELSNRESCPAVDGTEDVYTIGNIIFDDAGFKHGTKEILKGVHFTIEKNKTMAIVGGSGVGKTTCINLILKLYRLQSGKILINGMNINSVKRDSLMARIGCVFQNPLLFNRSIGENICLNEDYRKYLSGIEEAIRLADMDAFIKTLPDGYDTRVGDLGDKLSAGQKQRIVLARALFKDPELIILDEATASLDNVSERAIMDTVRALKGKKTILIVTHKLSILEDVDKIIVLKDGRISEEGLSSELLKNRGEYFCLYHAQYAAEDK